MSKIETLSADGDVLIAKAYKPRLLDSYKALIHITGDFGGGTASLKSSVDGGTTKVTLKDLTGVAYSVTANDVIEVELQCGATNSDAIYLYGSLSGSTSPDLTFTVHDGL